jgi:hypothetical protein
MEIRKVITAHFHTFTLLVVPLEAAPVVLKGMLL